jgi:hypothetical protein
MHTEANFKTQRMLFRMVHLDYLGRMDEISPHHCDFICGFSSRVVQIIVAGGYTNGKLALGAKSCVIQGLERFLCQTI